MINNCMQEVLEEIHEEQSNKGSYTDNLGDLPIGDDPSVLVACKDERTCLQLQDLVSHGAQEVGTSGRFGLPPFLQLTALSNDYVFFEVQHYMCPLSCSNFILFLSGDEGAVE